MRVLSVVMTIVALGIFTVAQVEKAKGLRLTDLPAAVQNTVRANLNGGEIKHISREKEDGVEQYEIETVLNGKARDFDVDSRGVLLVIEEQTSIDAIPAEARAGVLKKVSDGKLGRIETLSKPGKPLRYEAAYTDKKGNWHEVLVKADGGETKE